MKMNVVPSRTSFPFGDGSARAWTPGWRRALGLLFGTREHEGDRPAPPLTVVRTEESEAPTGVKGVKAGLLHASLSGLERLARVNVERSDRNELDLAGLADLVGEVALLARMGSAPWKLVLTALRVRVRLEPLPPEVHTIVLNVEEGENKVIGIPLAHLVILNMLCQLVSRWPTCAQPVIDIRFQDGQAQYTSTIRQLAVTELHELGQYVHTLDEVLSPLGHSLRMAASGEADGGHRLMIVIGT